MTEASSRNRMVLYVLIAVVAAANAGINTIDFTSLKEVVSFTLSVLGVGLVTARSYIDKSPSDVVKEPEEK